MRRALLLLLAAVPACATPGHVRRVEDQVLLLRAEGARQDSVRAAQLTELIQLQQRLADSLRAVRAQVQSAKGDLTNDLYNVQQQLVQLQELTGQSQRRLSELRTQLEARAEQLAAQPPADSGAPVASASAGQIYEASLQQLRRGSAATARGGFQELLRSYPNDERAPDALYFIGQSWGTEQPDSAGAYYRRVVAEHPKSDRAPAALYNLGLIAERAKDLPGARRAFQQVLNDYPRADEAALARDRLRAIGR